MPTPPLIPKKILRVLLTREVVLASIYRKERVWDEMSLKINAKICTDLFDE